MATENSGSFIHGYEAYWRRTRNEVHQAIRNSVIVLDTNSIVNLYRMASGGREEYFTVLENVADRLWVPRQVVDEFHRVRLSAVSSHISGLKSKSTAVTEAANAFKKALGDFARLYSLANGRVSEYMEPLDTAISAILEHVHGDVEGFDLDPGRLASEDPILDRLAELLDGKVGDGIAEGDLKAALDEAKRRGERKVPPGYKDWEDKGKDGVGDYLIWQEMVTFAKSNSRSILFISTDIKEDWLRRQAGFVIGPRPELVHEMQFEAGVSYHHVTLAEFLRTASEVLGVFVSPNTINRAEELEGDKAQVAKRIAERVDVARRNLAVASAEQALTSGKLADVSARHRDFRSQLDSLQRDVNSAKITDGDRENLLSKVADVSERLGEIRKLELNLRMDLASSDDLVGLARIDLATMQQLLAVTEAT